MTQPFQVLQDMLQLLKETVSSRHAERLETIVIWLIVVEIGTFLSCEYHMRSEIFFVLQVSASSPFSLTCSRNHLDAPWILYHSILYHEPWFVLLHV